MYDKTSVVIKQGSRIAIYVFKNVDVRHYGKTFAICSNTRNSAI